VWKALNLSWLTAVRECFYLMALVYAAIAAINSDGAKQKRVNYAHKKNHAASLFLMVD
jgi:hypothetical protein